MNNDRDKYQDEPKKTPDQAEGERDPKDKNTPTVGKTPSQAEGDRKTVDERLEKQEREGQ
jgi:hypothetical protein